MKGVRLKSNYNYAIFLVGGSVTRELDPWYLNKKLDQHKSQPLSDMFPFYTPTNLENVILLV